MAAGHLRKFEYPVPPALLTAGSSRLWDWICGDTSMPLGDRGHGTLRRIMRLSVLIRSRRPRGVRHSSTDKNRAA